MAGVEAAKTSSEDAKKIELLQSELAEKSLRYLVGGAVSVTITASQL